MDDRVLEKGLHQEAGTKACCSRRGDIEGDVQPVAEAHLLQRHIGARQIDLFARARSRAASRPEYGAKQISETASMRLAVWGSCFVSTEMFCRLLNRKCGFSRARSASSCAWFRLASSCDFSSASWWPAVPAGAAETAFGRSTLPPH